MGKHNNKLLKFLKSPYSRHPFVLLIAGSVAVFFVQQIIVIGLQRREKLLDRKYEIVERVSSFPIEYSQGTWDLFWSIQKEDLKERDKCRTKLQSLSIEAAAIKAELHFFRNNNIVKEWNNFITIYNGAIYKLLEGQEVTQKELNNLLDSANPNVYMAIKEVYAELR